MQMDFGEFHEFTFIFILILVDRLYDSLHIYSGSKLCIKQPQDELFLSIFEEDIVKNVQISNFSQIMNNF